MCYIISKPTGISGTLLADAEYPQRVAFSLLNKVLEEFTAKYSGNWNQGRVDNCMPFPELDGYILKWQDPHEADKIMAIQKDLDETKEVLVFLLKLLLPFTDNYPFLLQYNTIDQVLERGQKLDDLIERSESLSSQSKTFYKTAKKHNQCCKAYWSKVISQKVAFFCTESVFNR